MIGEIPQLKAPKKVLENLGKEYSKRVNSSRMARDERMKSIWALCLKNYEGHADPENWPWPNSSNAVVNLTGAHTDAWAARLRNAGTTQDPVYTISPWAGEEIIPGLSAKDYAELYQEYSKWLEKEEIPNEEFVEKITTVMAKYGNVIAYIPFEHEIVQEVVDYDDKGKPIKEEMDIINRPFVHIIHPKNFYMEVAEEDIQLSQWCGFDTYLSAQQIRLKIKTGAWDKEDGETILNYHSEKTTKELARAGGPKDGGYFRQTEDGRYLPTPEWEQEQRRALRVPNSPTSFGVPFVRIFAREDIDNDGFLEQIEFLIHVDTGTVAEIYYHRYKHGKRPLVLFSFLWREGTWMHISVPEMLFNSQRAMNEVLRDHLNNNKIRNMKVFVARAGGVVGPDEPMFPGRVILAQNPEADVIAMDLGSGTPSTSLQDLEYLRAIAERRDGMTDSNLGREQRSRTPATTMLAVLEEGNERVVSIIARLRRGQQEIWTQVHQLYVQNKDAEGLDRVIGVEKADQLRAAWAAMDVKDIRRKLICNAQVSTQNLNKAVQRAEVTALVGQIDMLQRRSLELLSILRQTADPVARAIIISMLRSQHSLAKTVLFGYGFKEQDELNPDVATAAEQLPPGPPLIPPDPGAPNAQVEQAGATTPEQGPLNAPGRPEAGMPRFDQGGESG